MGKRARERARQERQDAKRQRRRERTEEPEQLPVDEAGLLEEFRRLSEDHAADRVTESRYQETRARILAELGIEPDEDE